MDLKASPFITLTIILTFSCTTTPISAINITSVLERFPNFSTMNELFTETGLEAAINKRQAITVLAVDNGAIGSISSRPEEELKSILMTHVVLDYLDELKLKGLRDKSNMFTTLYQTTGLGEQQNGFLNCTMINETLFFGSAVKESPLNARYVSSVFQNPFNLSVVQISTPIVAPGLGSLVQALPPSPFTQPPAPAPKTGAKAPAPAPKKEAKAPAPGPSDEDHNSGASPGAGPPQARSSDDDSSAAPDSEKNTAAADKNKPPSSSGYSSGFSVGAALLLGLVASFAGF